MSIWGSTIDKGVLPKSRFEKEKAVSVMGDATMVVLFKRYSIILFLLVLCCLVLWVNFAAPVYEEATSAWAALNTTSADGGIFGKNSRPKYPGVIHIKTLDPSLLPQSSHGKSGPKSEKKRLVFVGDIHGCREELESLLKKAKFNALTDHLVSVGDIVSKGPDSSGVIDLLHHYQASCVRGNHDDRLLLVAQSLRSRTTMKKQGSEEDADADDIDPVKKLARSLSNHQFNYLQSCPAILRIGELKAFGGEAVVVHGGLIPGLELESQDPIEAMNMRVIDLKTHIPSSKHKLKGSRPWYKLWNRYQRLLSLHQRLGSLKSKGGRPAEKHMTVIYGHDAREGLQIHRYTKGLDSGCVRGGKLTALVVDGDGKQKIFQVKAKKHRLQAASQTDVLRDGGPEVPRNEKSG